MDRRETLRLLATGAIAAPAIITGCTSDDKKPDATNDAEPVFQLDRSPEELKREKELIAQGKYFSEHEMATIAVLADIIIPKDEISGSATEAKVPEFIDFIVRDMPNHQLPMRGGLRWLDLQCFKRYNKSFKDCSATEQIQMVDMIAYPNKPNIEKDLKPGVAFFSRMRDLTATGFYTSAIGVKDIGYEGNKPNQWNGVPDDVLKQHGIAYTEKELMECINFDKP